MGNRISLDNEKRILEIGKEKGIDIFKINLNKKIMN